MVSHPPVVEGAKVYGIGIGLLRAESLAVNDLGEVGVGGKLEALTS